MLREAGLHRVDLAELERKTESILGYLRDGMEPALVGPGPRRLCFFFGGGRSSGSVLSVRCTGVGVCSFI